jgi:hypothetical protein
MEVCHGWNYSILLESEYLVLQKCWRRRSSQKVPLREIRSVIVERKSVIPFATMTVLFLIVTIALKYNALWFLLDLTGDSKFSTAAFLIVLIFAFPTFSRMLFVNVQISTQTAIWRVRFVPAQSGKRLVKRLQEFSGSWT